MAAMIASAPIRARKRMEPSPAAVGRPSTRARPTPLPRGCAANRTQPQHPPGHGCGSSPEQGDAFGDRRLFEVAIERRQGQPFPLGEFQISGVVHGKLPFAGESHQDRLISRGLQSNGQQAEITKERRRHHFSNAFSPLAYEKGVADLIVEETWSERLDARDRVERDFDAWIGFLVEEPCSQNRRIDHEAQYLCPSWRLARISASGALRVFSRRALRRAIASATSAARPSASGTTRAIVLPCRVMRTVRPRSTSSRSSAHLALASEA